MDFNGSGQLTERYLTNPNGLNQFYGQVNASGVTQWFLTDNLGSIRQVVDANGNPLYAVTYDPFGSIVSQTNPANAPRFGYAGGVYDPIMGTWQFGHREENPTDGRWLSQDPDGFAAGDTNLQRYVGNDPTNATDPTGREGPNRYEMAAAVRYPISAFRGNQAASEAGDLAAKAANDLGVSGTIHNGPEDALRHAIWNALMAQRIGVEKAELFATLHEAVPNPIPEELLMDMWNNEVGRAIGAANTAANPETVMGLVKQAYNNGQLRILRTTGSGRVPQGTLLKVSGRGPAGSPPTTPTKPSYGKYEKTYMPGF
jgi:RHS repeat-associated protein